MQYLTDVSNLKIATPSMPWEERGGVVFGVLQFLVEYLSNLVFWSVGGEEGIMFTFQRKNLIHFIL